jgi:ubiquinone/menaquinone biosynthesis C-methylase UbiE
MLAEIGHNVTGVDLSSGMLSVARGKAREMGLNIDFRLGDAMALSEPDAAYDLVVARHVVWTLPDPDRAIGEWLRILRPGGRIQLVEGKWPTKVVPNSSPSTALADMVYSALDILSLFVRAERRARVFKGLYARKWARVEASLPFNGGPSADQLLELLRAHNVSELKVEPIMSPQLWGGKTPRYPRFVASGRR